MKLTAVGKRVLVFIILILVILSLNFYRPGVKNFFYLISQPIQKVFWRAGNRVSNFFSSFGSKNYFRKEIEKLTLENQKLLSEIAFLKELEKENEILRGALDIGLQKEFKLILAQIIGKDISQDFILIDKGKKDGILENLPVITQEKVLIGKISKVYENFSKIMLISNKESSFDAKIFTPSEKEITGVVRGRGDFKISLELVPQEAELKEGDILITSALAGIYPSELLVGKISKVEKSDVEPFQKVEILPFFDIGIIRHLFIITNH